MFNGRPAYERLPMYSSSSTPRLRSSSSATSSATSYPSQRLFAPPSPSSSTSSPSPTSRQFKPPYRYRSSSRDAKRRFPYYFLSTFRSPPLVTALKVAIPATLVALIILFIFYEPHVELAFYSRRWVRDEIETVAPLAGCFDP